MKWITEQRAIKDLIPAEYNPRKLSDKQAKDLSKSIERFDLADPIIINKDNKVIGGHQRLKILTQKSVGLVDVRVPDRQLTIEEEKELNVRLNKNLGEWDFELLADFDKDMLADVGFDVEDLDKIFPVEVSEQDDVVPDVPEEPNAKLGDIYKLGNHRVMCGDSTKVDDVERLMDGKKADMVFTDPPYGMNYSGRGKETSNKIMGDNIDPTEFYNLGSEIAERYIWGRVENYKHLLVEPRDIIIWKKNNFGMGKGYRGQYECCFYYGDFSGSDSDVWDIAKDSKYTHPTQKPVELCVRAIKNSQPNIIIDYFLGSGSTIIACEKTNRVCYGMELDPKYTDVIIKRWEDFTNGKAIKL